MMKTLKEYSVNMPCWSLPYIVNNDASGMPDEDIKLVDDYMSQYYKEAEKHGGQVIVGAVGPEAEPFFTWCPDFGLACECAEYLVLIVK